MKASTFGRRGTRRALLAPLAIACLLGGLAAQETRLQRDLQFVRDLAGKLRFISLAQGEVDRLKQRYTDGDAFQSVSQLGVEISLFGAKAHPDREERRTLYKNALEQVQDFLSRYDDGPAADAARMTLADASLEFGRFLADELELARNDAPEKVEALTEDAREVFRRGEEACDAVMSALEGRKDSDRRAWTNFHLVWKDKGILLREHARAIKKDRDYLAARSRDTLEELIFEVGEETALGQRALFEYAQNYEVLGEFDDAVSSYKDVIESSNTVLTDETIEINPDVRELMVVTLEEAFERAADTRLAQGKPEAVIELVKQYREYLTRYNVPLMDLANPVEGQGKEDERFGHGLYLSYAQALAETGSVQKGMQLVQTLNDWHPNDLVGLRAKSVLKSLLATPGRQVDGALLLEVAKGDYQSKSYETAIQGVRRALGAMDRSEQSQHGLDAYYIMAHSMAIQGRVLEATLALKTALDTYGKTSEDVTNRERCASLIQRTMRQVRANTKNDRAFDPLGDEVNRVVQENGTAEDADKRSWNDGLRLISDRRYEDAIRTLERISLASTYFEWAKARIATCYQRLDDFAAARKAIADYHAFRGTKDANIAAEDSSRQQVREIAEGEIAFLEGYMLFEEAMGTVGGKRDLTKLPKVVEALSDFESRHGAVVSSMVPRAIYTLGRTFVEMGKLDKAEEKYRQLQEKTPRNATVAILGTAIFTAYHDMVTAQETEVQAIEQRNEDSKAARERLNALRRKTAALGIEYMRTADAPQYQIAYITLKHFEALRDWQQVESFGTQVVEQYGEDAEVAGKVDRYVRPVIGDAVLRQHNYRKAYDMLVKAEAASPKNYDLKRLIALALGGWQEIDETGNRKVYTGLGKPAEAYDKYWNEYRKYALDSTEAFEDYSLPWYRYWFELLHFAKEAAKTDSKFESIARTCYGKAQSTDDFATLESFGNEGRNLRSLFLDNR